MKRLFAILLFTALISALLCVTGCEKKDDANNNGKLKIVATNFPAYDFAKVIAKYDAEITMLMPYGAESHGFEPSPKDIIKIQSCDLFICIGGTDEYWAEKVLQSFDNSKISVLKLIEKVKTLTEDDDDHEIDEHIWTSPANAIIMAEEIRNALNKIDEKNADIYTNNAGKFTSEIKEIQSEIRKIADSAESKTLIFGSRFPFRYFADEFGFECYSAFPACSEESEPSAATVAMLVDKIKADKIPAVFYPELSNTNVAELLSKETGAMPLLLHSCHNITKQEYENGETYITLMKKNTENLKIGLNVK